HGAWELAHLEEELHGEELHLLSAQLSVGDGVPQRMPTEGSPRLDAREQILDELLGSEHLAHDHGSSSQGRSSGAMPPPTGKNWRCAYVSRAMPWLSSFRNARLRSSVKSMRV